MGEGDTAVFCVEQKCIFSAQEPWPVEIIYIVHADTLIGNHPSDIVEEGDMLAVHMDGEAFLNIQTEETALNDIVGARRFPVKGRALFEGGIAVRKIKLNGGVVADGSDLCFVQRIGTVVDLQPVVQGVTFNFPFEQLHQRRIVRGFREHAALVNVAVRQVDQIGLPGLIRLQENLGIAVTVQVVAVVEERDKGAALTVDVCGNLVSVAVAGRALENQAQAVQFAGGEEGLDVGKLSVEETGVGFLCLVVGETEILGSVGGSKPPCQLPGLRLGENAVAFGEAAVRILNQVDLEGEMSVQRRFADGRFRAGGGGIGVFDTA